MHPDDPRDADDAESHANEAGPTLTRRRFAKASAAMGLGAAGSSASTPAAAQSGGVPSYDQAASELSHPDPAEEAVALYRYLHDEWGERMLSGQQHEPWGIDEMDYVESTTGQLPAVSGADFIHDDKSHTVQQARDWWDRGGIPSVMWHWGVPGLELDDEYEESRDEYIGDYDVAAVLEDGTDANDAFWQELDEVGDRLAELRDAGVPLVWRPFHEFEGGWFWWGMEGADFFVELWETMHDHFVNERDLDNLVWLLPHTGNPNQAWVPDSSTYDLGGADSYPGGRGSQSGTYDQIVSMHGERPPIFHECGTPLDPDNVEQDDAWWVMWTLWHTSHLEETEDSYLNHVYDHELTVTLDDVPDVVAEYGEDGQTCEPTPIEPYLRVDGGELRNAAEVTVEPDTTVELQPEAGDGGSWFWTGPYVEEFGRSLTVSPTSTTTFTAEYTNECGGASVQQFAVTVEEDSTCDDAAGGSATVDGQTVCDANDDGHYRDVTGDGAVGQGDVAEFFTKQHRSAWKQPDMFDFSENGAVTHGDVVDLFDYVAVN